MALSFDYDIAVPNPPELIGYSTRCARVANILQTVYFDLRPISPAVRTLMERLKGEVSWFVLGRTDDHGKNGASIFRVERGRFVLEARMGRGSEIDSLVLQEASS